MGKKKIFPSCVGVIPARFASRRFPGKPLSVLAGKPLIQHVYEKASRAKYLSRLIVATDEERIADVVKRFGGEVILTKKEHRNGMERIGEVARKFEGEYFVNIQGDEPLISPDEIDRCGKGILESDDCSVFTLASPIEKGEDIENRNVVKVVVDLSGFALYFSRAQIPSSGAGRDYLKHIGIYAYRRAPLLQVSRARPSPLETLEDLEQLRFLEYGHKVKVGITSYEGRGVDTKEDLEELEKLLSGRGNL